MRDTHKNLLDPQGADADAMTIFCTYKIQKNHLSIQIFMFRLNQFV